MKIKFSVLCVGIACLALGHAAALAGDEVTSLLNDKAYNKALVALKKQPPTPQTRLQLALALAGSGDRNAAKDILQALLQEYPDDVEVINNLALLHAADNDAKKAAELLANALQQHPQYGVVFENLGKLYALMASEAYKKALGDSKVEPQALQLTPFVELTRSIPPAVAIAPEPIASAVPVAQAATETSLATPTTAPAPPAIADAAALETAVLQRVRSWADAWSEQQVDRYLSHYSPKFNASPLSFDEWSKQRRLRVAAPASIRVTVHNPKVTLLHGGELASVDFIQEYKSPTFHERILKRLILSRFSGQWLILEEIVEQNL